MLEVKVVSKRRSDIFKKQVLPFLTIAFLTNNGLRSNHKRKANVHNDLLVYGMSAIVE